MNSFTLYLLARNNLRIVPCDDILSGASNYTYDASLFVCHCRPDLICGPDVWKLYLVRKSYSCYIFNAYCFGLLNSL